VRNIESIREKGCIFCTKPAAGDDRASLILHRGKTAYIIMNLYPYNTGHVMVAPFRHVGELEDLDGEEILEMMNLATTAVRVIKEEMRPQGFNLGINVGKVAGAGFDRHVHVHIVPRWKGDSNFMTVVGDAKVMPENIEDTYDRLLRAFRAFLPGEH